jgi:hypothetical protein
MELKEYFENKRGLGVFATADADGRVDAAVYSRPHIMEDGTIAFIMRDRLTHHNLKSNPHATFLFKEDGSGYNGMRLYLTKVKEEKNTERLEALRRRRKDYDEEEVRFLVYFRIDKSLPLIGSEA